MGAGTDPVYLRVLEDLRAQIRDGVLAPGSRVPSRNGIMARYGVGETAAKHALQVLATEGLIEARAGSGSYVRHVPGRGVNSFCWPRAVDANPVSCAAAGAAIAPFKNVRRSINPRWMCPFVGSLDGHRA